MSLPDPILPLELERVIFVLTLQVQNEPAHPVNLLLVAKRVHEWLIPVLYKTIVRHSSRTYPLNVNASSPSLAITTYGRYTQNLLMEYKAGEDDEVANTLHYCPQIRRLALWGGVSLIGATRNMLKLNSVTELSVNVPQLNIPFIDWDHSKIDPKGTAHPEYVEQVEEFQIKYRDFLSKITHLDISGHFDDVTKVEDMGPALKHLKDLTHLCVPDLKGFTRLIKEVVKKCPKVGVIVWIVNLKSVAVIEVAGMRCVSVGGENSGLRPEVNWFHCVLPGADAVFEAKGLDERTREKIVTICRLDPVMTWEEGARGGEDMWTLVDDVIQERSQKNSVRKV
ncbi:hypothetical protein BDN72DRAFT_902689 [Pluteus cervinus]|uniref:Uncharacterized protein n=1 Tax=Pluteus cervinus TaxID=181527 RepID=A0ACD3ABW7_9AGAR|nr:hypothetical protein BDN72DRAFT_902689 [Pluteus cervinus]